MKGGKKGSLAYHEAFASNLLYIFLNIFYTDIPIHVPVFQVTQSPVLLVGRQARFVKTRRPERRGGWPSFYFLFSFLLLCYTLQPPPRIHRQPQLAYIISTWMTFVQFSQPQLLPKARPRRNTGDGNACVCCCVDVLAVGGWEGRG